MATGSVRARVAWEDRFRTPKIDELLEVFNKQTLPALEFARAKLLEVAGVREDLSWQGIPWRWCLTYRVGSAERPWAYLVLEPNKARLALPLTADAVSRLPARKMSKTIRDAIAQASQVGGVYWASWELTSKALSEELVDTVAMASLEGVGEPVAAS